MPSGSPRGPRQQRDRSMSSQSAGDTNSLGAFDQGVRPDCLEERLRRLNARDQSPAERPPLAGQRIADYENALTPSVPRQALGFKVMKRADNETARVNLDDFPNGMRLLARSSCRYHSNLAHRDPNAHTLSFASRLARLRGLGV